MDATDLIAPQWPKPAVSCAVFRGRHVLLIERGKGVLKGRWSLPGGHIEPGEPARDAALREVLEETGVTARLLGLADVLDVIIPSANVDDTPTGRLHAHYVLSVFFGIWLDGEPVGRSDAVDAVFVPLTDIGAYPLTDGAHQVIVRANNLLSLAAQ